MGTIGYGYHLKAISLLIRFSLDFVGFYCVGDRY